MISYLPVLCYCWSLSGPASVVDSLIVVLVTDVPAVMMYLLH